MERKEIMNDIKSRIHEKMTREMLYSSLVAGVAARADSEILKVSIEFSLAKTEDEEIRIITKLSEIESLAARIIDDAKAYSENPLLNVTDKNFAIYNETLNFLKSYSEPWVSIMY